LVDHEPKRMHRLRTAQRFAAVIKGVASELWAPCDLSLKNISASITRIFMIRYYIRDNHSSNF
jgi:hypothetical protein